MNTPSGMNHFDIIFVPPQAPWAAGGVERIAGEVAERLKKDFDIAIYCTGEKPDSLYWKDIPVFIFRGYTKAYFFSPTLYRALRKSRADLIHAHTFTTFMPFAASMSDKTFVFNPHFHHLASTLPFEMLRKIYDPTVGNYLFRNAGFIICNSHTERKLILKHFEIPPTKIDVIYNGVDIAKVRNAKPFDLDKKLILYVGRLERYKNVQVAVEAIKHLPQDYLLYIIGKGNYESSLRMRVRKLDLNKRVKFLGYVSDEEMYRWLKTCSVFVHFSEIESFGMTCIEALAAGRPVIANDDKFGLKETADLFRGKGIFTVDVRRNSIIEISEIIKEAEQLTVKVDLSDFDWNTITARFKEVYSRTLKNY